VTNKFEVTGYDKQGRETFHLEVEAPNEIVAKLYATADLQRTADGAAAVTSAVKTEVCEQLNATPSARSVR
jgi:hypothetical protein